MGVLCEAERKKKVDNKSNEIPINKIPINEIPTNEALIGGIKPTELDPCISYASKSFCKIFCQGIFGSGFPMNVERKRRCDIETRRYRFLLPISFFANITALEACIPAILSSESFPVLFRSFSV